MNRWDVAAVIFGLTFGYLGLCILAVLLPRYIAWKRRREWRLMWR